MQPRVRNNSKKDFNLYPFVLYVLECNIPTDIKYYVGITTDFPTRFNAHKTGTGSSFTKKYKVLAVIHKQNLGICTWSTAETLENYKVLELATKYGYENVAGGSYKKKGQLEKAVKNNSNPYK